MLQKHRSGREAHLWPNFLFLKIDFLCAIFPAFLALFSPIFGFVAQLFDFFLRLEIQFPWHNFEIFLGLNRQFLGHNFESFLGLNYYVSLSLSASIDFSMYDYFYDLYRVDGEMG